MIRRGLGRRALRGGAAPGAGEAVGDEPRRQPHQRPHDGVAGMVHPQVGARVDGEQREHDQGRQQYRRYSEPSSTVAITTLVACADGNQLPAQAIPICRMPLYSR